MKTKISSETKMKIIELMKIGVSRKKISRLVNICRNTISTIIRVYRKKIRMGGKSEDKNKRVVVETKINLQIGEYPLSLSMQQNQQVLLFLIQIYTQEVMCLPKDFNILSRIQLIQFSNLSQNIIKSYSQQEVEIRLHQEQQMNDTQDLDVNQALLKNIYINQIENSNKSETNGIKDFFQKSINALKELQEVTTKKRRSQPETSQNVHILEVSDMI